MRRSNWLTASPYVLLIAVMGLGIFTAALLSSPANSWAQGDNSTTGESTAPASTEGAGNELTLEKPVPPKPETKPESTDDATVQDRTMLQWMFQSLGVSYSIIFLAISFTLVSLLVMNLLTARREALLPMALIEGFEALLNEKKYQEAYELAKSDDSMLGQVLSAGLAKLSRGYNQAIEGMQETGEDENMKLEHRLSYIALIGTISPMIGLLGTVQGMIASFQVIAVSSTTPPPAKLAEGIATALFTTLVGLMVAIPAIAAYNILRNRIARLVLEVGILSEDLMSRFSNVGEKKN